MNVLFVTDEKFAEICAVAMRSITEIDEGVCFYVILDNVSDTIKNKIKRSIGKKKCEIKFITAEHVQNRFNINIESGIWPLICLQRLFLCDYLPKELNKILYLDCDIIARNSLKELYEIEFDKEEYCAAVPDCVSDICRNNIGIDNRSNYYNSGVVLINLELWRKENVAEKFMTIMYENEGKLQYPDQDIINIAFKNKIKTLNAKYNVTSYEYAYTYDELMFYHNASFYIDKNEFELAINNPNIFHFTNDILLTRPWINGTNHPYFAEWFAIREKTAWCGEKLWKNNEKLTTRIKCFFSRKLPKNLVLLFAKYLNRWHSFSYSKNKLWSVFALRWHK